MNNISIYGGHNASISFLDSKNNYRIIELERLFKSRHFMLFDKSENEFIEIVKQVLKVADKFWNIKNDFETCAYGINGSSHLHSINKAINVKKIIQYNHHDSHAACAFYQSSYENSVIISFDGGGNDGVFNLYYGEYQGSVSLFRDF
jgi:carbamoyltransferase